MGKKKRRLLSPKFANWRKANGIGVKSAPVVEEKTEEVKTPKSEVTLEKQESVPEKIVEQPKTTKKTTTKKPTTKKTTTTTRKRRTTKAKAETSDI